MNMTKTIWIVWIGGIDDHYENKQEAENAVALWKSKGYDDVQLEKVTLKKAQINLERIKYG